MRAMTRDYPFTLKAGSGSSWEHLRAHAAERRVPPRAVEARISGRYAVSRRREPPKVGRQVLGNRRSIQLSYGSLV